MSVYIPDMKMPDRCFACPLCIGEVDDWSCAISHGSYIEYREIDTNTALDARPNWCPLVPVPEHGRLIDANALTYLMGMDEHFSPLEAMYLMELIADAHTIVPADKEGGDR